MPRKGTANAPVALVTGGARGIGLAIAEWFLANGHRVALLDIDRRQLARTDRSLGDRIRVMAIPCDVSDAKQVKSAVARVAKGFGRIDALVNNAGVAVF